MGHEDTKLIELEQILIDCSIDVGKFLREGALSITDLEWKKVDDPVTNLDKEAEKRVRDTIKSRMNVNLIGEEYGIEDNGSDITIYIDPIDGTKSFARAEYLSSLSLAAEYKGNLVAGTVNDFMRQMLYFASSEGSYIKQPHGTVKKLPMVEFSLSKPTIQFSRDRAYTEALADNVHFRQQVGSVALSMAQLAAGTYDGLIMSPYNKRGATGICDIAAGYLIMKQAGMVITDYYGREYNYKNPRNSIIAYHKDLDRSIKNIILKTQKEELDMHRELFQEV